MQGPELGDGRRANELSPTSSNLSEENASGECQPRRRYLRVPYSIGFATYEHKLSV